MGIFLSSPAPGEGQDGGHAHESFAAQVSCSAGERKVMKHFVLFIVKLRSSRCGCRLLH